MRHQAMNKFNVPEVLSVLVKALEAAGLEETVDELKRKDFFKLVNDAWMKRKKSSHLRVAQEWMLRADKKARGISILEPSFWMLVDKIGWGTKTTDFEAVQKAIMLKYSPLEAEALGDIKDKLFHALYQRLDQWEDTEEGKPFEMGDDSFSDLVNHIIGLGKREYDAVMKDPKRAWERAMKGLYEESFSYVFPSHSDYASLNLKHYTRWANRIINGFQKHILSNRAFSSMHRDALTIVDALKLMAGGDVNAFLDTQNVVLTLFKKMQRNYEAKLKALGGRLPARADDNPLVSGAWLENLYIDARRFTEKTPIKLASKGWRR